MQLAGPLAQQLRWIEIAAVGIADRLGARRIVGQRCRDDRGNVRRSEWWRVLEGGRALVVRAHLVERVLPRVALVFDELLEDAQRGGLAGRAVCEPSGNVGHVLEAGVGQRLADLEVWVDAWLQAAEDLEDQPVAERDARVALLALAWPGIQGSSPPQPSKGLRGMSADECAAPVETPPRADRVEQ